MERSGANQTVIQLALLAGGFFIGYKILTSLAGKIKDVATDAGHALGDRLGKWIYGAPIGVLGKFIVQTNGAVLDPIQYPIAWMKSSDPAAIPHGGALPTIRYNNAVYVLGTRDLNGNWPAVKL